MRPGSSTILQVRGGRACASPWRHIHPGAAARHWCRDRARQVRRPGRGGGCCGPSACSSAVSSAISLKAFSKGSSSVIWLPICMSMPATSIAGQRRGAGIDVDARACRRCRTCPPPCRCVILWWVLASTSGLTRIDTVARWPMRLATSRQQFELRLRFDVEAGDALLQRQRHLARRLADAGEHDLAGRNARRPGRGAVRLPRPRPCRHPDRPWC